MCKIQADAMPFGNKLQIFNASALQLCSQDNFIAQTLRWRICYIQ